MDSELDEFKEFYFNIKPALIRVIAQERKLKLDDYKARKGFITNALNGLDLGQTDLSDLYCDYLINLSESIYIYQLDIFEYVERYFFDPIIIRNLQDATLIKNMLSNNAKPKSISGFVEFALEGNTENREFLDLYYVALSALETIFYIWLCCTSRYLNFSNAKQSLLQMSILNSFTSLSKISERYFSNHVLGKLFPPQRVYAKKVKSMRRTFLIFKFLQSHNIYGTPSFIAGLIRKENRYKTLNTFLEQSGQKPFKVTDNYKNTLTKAISRPLERNAKLKDIKVLDEASLKIALREFSLGMDI